MLSDDLFSTSRTGTAELVKSLDEVDVPMLVFSAGLGDVVNAILKCHGVVNKNIHVISNFLKYKDGHVNGFTNDIVHPFNKNGKAAEHTKYFEVRGRFPISYLFH